MTDYFELGRILKPQGLRGEIKLDAFTAVSYTHLDVYKRQLQPRRQSKA